MANGGETLVSRDVGQLLGLGEVEPDPLEDVVLRGAVTAVGGLPKSSPGGGAERTPAGRGCVCPGCGETPREDVARPGELLSATEGAPSPWDPPQ